MYRKEIVDVFFGSVQGQLPAVNASSRHIRPAEEFAQLLRIVPCTWEWILTRHFTRQHQGLPLWRLVGHDFVANSIQFEQEMSICTCRTITDHPNISQHDSSVAQHCAALRARRFRNIFKFPFGKKICILPHILKEEYGDHISYSQTQPQPYNVSLTI